MREVLTHNAGDFNYPQLPPVLRTFAVPPFGVQTGTAVSLPEALPPLVAVTFAKPPSVEQSANADALFLALDVAVQFAVDSDVAPLLLLATALAPPLLHWAVAPLL